MDKPISVGDMAVVVHWPCCKGDLGYVERVTEISRGSPSGGYCSHCGKEHSKKAVMKAILGGAKFPLSWLKRIPPLEELDGEKRDEEITA